RHRNVTGVQTCALPISIPPEKQNGPCRAAGRDRRGHGSPCPPSFPPPFQARKAPPFPAAPWGRACAAVGRPAIVPHRRSGSEKRSEERRVGKGGRAGWE